MAIKEHQHWIIEPVPSTTAHKLVVEQQSNRLKKQSEKRNSDIPRFQYKDIALFHIKLKMFLTHWLHMFFTRFLNSLKMFFEPKYK